MSRRSAALGVVMLAVAVLLPSAAPAQTDAVLWGTHFSDSLEPLPRAMERVAAQGSSVLRLPIRWLNIEPQRGARYDWRESDAEVLAAAENGIRVLATVHGTPNWAATADPRRDRRHTQAPPRPALYPAYAAHLRAMVARYGPGGDLWRENGDVTPVPIGTWEIHNEPNAAAYWTDGRPDPDQYAELVRVSARAIRGVDPRAEVVIGSTASSCRQICPEDFLRRVFARPGIARLTDSVSFHAYSRRPGAVIASARAVRRAVTEHDSRETGLHLTEFGFGACEDPERGLCVGEEAQALLLAVAFERLEREGQALGLRTAHWFLQHDLVPCRDMPFCTFGLVTLDPKASPRERLAWEAYRGFIEGERVTAPPPPDPEES